MANMYFDDDFEVCSIGNPPTYLYIDNVEDFLNDCGDEYVSDNVEETGVYQWDFFNYVWVDADFEIEQKINSLVKEINSSCQEPTNQNNKSIGWNILITLNTGEVIQTNSEPVPMNEVHEAIDILLRPSFFGKTIKKFEIVAV